MDFLEKDLEDIIYEAYGQGKWQELQDRGLGFIEPGMWLYRQVNIEGYGVADLVFLDVSRLKNPAYGTQFVAEIYVCELKKDALNYASLGQVMRYKEAFNKINSFMPENTRVLVHPVLIGSRVDLTTDFGHVIPNLYDCQVYTYKYGLEGLIFKDISEVSYRQKKSSLESLQALVKSFRVEKYAAHKISLGLPFTKYFNREKDSTPENHG